MQYYSIRDGDVYDHLHTWRNSTSKRECLEAYLYYRQPDLGERWTLMWLPEDLDIEHFDALFKFFVKGIDDDWIIEDMSCCNFQLEEHSELHPE